ncbi:hypothetical protein [Microbacterium sp. 3J1]|uniref:hypothetical protein n=1 Tax=Microbacterium sp. 3J1 TaxID=861269 RepID=UPI000AAA8C7C|nr:hypothetical protein [Microbacterium sp. 3J1]
MDMSTGDEESVVGEIEIEVEAAPQGLMRFTLDAAGKGRVWHSMLIAHDDQVIGAASSPEQTAELLVRGSIECVREFIPSLEVGGLTMRPERGPNDNAQIVAAGEARFLTSEWTAVVRAQGDAPPV